MRNLSRGDRGKEVLDVQHRLRGQGHDLGTEGSDGFFGPKTQLALRTFQQARGLLADGIVGDNTWRELVEAGYTLGDRLLYLAEPPFRGDDVLALQVKLNLLGFNAGPERSVYDQSVERAVLDFQRNAGLPIDGLVGENTLAKLRALRKAESGRESKKIPERDGGFVSVRSLAGQAIVVDPGHGGGDHGFTSAAGLLEKDFNALLGQRIIELLKAEGCRVTSTRDDDQELELDERAELAEAAAADYLISLHCNSSRSAAARGCACYYFKRGHYYSEHGQRLANCIGARLDAAGAPLIGTFGRNFGILREVRAIAVYVEPLFLSNGDEAERATKPETIEGFAQAIAAGFADYVTRRIPGPAGG